MDAHEKGEAIVQPPRDFDAFVSNWGEVAGFDNLEQFRRLWSVAEQSYSNPSLPYHKFEHALDVLWKSMELVDLWEANILNHTDQQEIPKRKALIIASLFHDSGFGEDYQAKNNETPEAYSADLLTAAAQAENISEEDIYVARQLVLATTPGYIIKNNDPLKINKKLLIRADIDNIGGDYSNDFTSANTALLKEAVILAQRNGEFVDKTIFAANALKILSSYIDQKPILSPLWDTMYSDWYTNARRNIKKYAREQAAFNEQDYIYFVRSIGSPIVDRVVLGTDRLFSEED